MWLVSLKKLSNIISCFVLLSHSHWLMKKSLHISLNPIGRSFQWQLRRLNWANLFERSTNQPLFAAVFFPQNTWNTFDFSRWSPDEIMRLLAWLHISTRDALSHKSHGIVWYYLHSLALTRSNSQHCSVLSRLLSSRGLLFRELPRHIFVC